MAGAPSGYCLPQVTTEGIECLSGNFLKLGGLIISALPWRLPWVSFSGFPDRPFTINYVFQLLVQLIIAEGLPSWPRHMLWIKAGVWHHAFTSMLIPPGHTALTGVCPELICTATLTVSLGLLWLGCSHQKLHIW